MNERSENENTCQGGNLDRSAIPAELQAIPQWVVWRTEQREGNPTKVPYNARTGHQASTTNPATWAAFAWAITQAESHAESDEQRYDGIGFVLTEGDPFAGVDLDSCRNPETGEVALWAQEIIADLSSFSEVSPGSYGVHIFVRGVLPTGRHVKVVNGVAGTQPGKPAKIELYDRARYLTVTGHRLPDTLPTIEDRQEKLVALHRRLFGEHSAESTATPATASLSTVGLDFTEPPSETDRLLAERILSEHPAILQSWELDESKGDYAFACEIIRRLLSTLEPQVEDVDLMQAADRVFRASSLFARPDRQEKWMRSATNYAALTLGRAIKDVRDAAVNSTRPWRIPPGDAPIVAKNMYDLTNRDIPPQRWLVPWIVPEGKIVLQLGKPKKGKSTIASQATLDGVGDVRMWNYPTSLQDASVPDNEKQTAEVVIFSMEESEDNVSDRIKKQLSGQPIPHRRIHHIERQGPVHLLKLLDWLDDQITSGRNIRMVVLDPWGLVIFEDNERNPYLREYNKIAPLRQFQKKHPQVSFFIVNHARKAGADEITDASVSTTGLPGAVDVTIWLQRERQDPDATIEFEGRVGAAHPKIALMFDEATRRWKYIGVAHEVAGLKKTARVDEFLEQHLGDGFEIADFVGWLESVEDKSVTVKTAQRMLRKSNLVESTREGVPGKRGGSIVRWKRRNWLGQPSEAAESSISDTKEAQQE